MIPAASRASRLAARLAGARRWRSAPSRWPPSPTGRSSRSRSSRWRRCSWLWLRAPTPRAAAALGFCVRPRAFLRRRVVGLRQPARLRRRCRRRSPASPRSASARSSRSSRRPSAGCRLGSAAPVPVARSCSSSPRRGRSPSGCAAGSSPAFPGSRSATRRSTARCRATRRSPASTACLARDAVSAGSLLLRCVVTRRRGAHRRGIARSAALACRRLGALRAIDWTAPVRRAGHVALLQGNIAQDMKFGPGATRRRSTPTRGSPSEPNARLDRAARDRAAALPRTRSTRPISRAHGAASPRNGGDLLIGVPERGRARRLLQQRDRSARRRSRRTARSHLVPFGEFMPPGFGWIVACWRSRCGFHARRARTSSRSRSPASASRSTSATRTCSASEIIRQLPAATLLVNVSNVAWFGDSLAPAPAPADRADARARDRALHAARDQHRHDRDHRARRGGRRAPAAVHRRGPRGPGPGPDGGATPYAAAGNAPVVLVCLVILAAAAVRARAKRRRDADLGAGA